ncbi:MAG: tol-pal system-associated acyl-CoA thioesterase [Rhodocyclaceae bacterium]|nr:tol-pal system-associated acyl-CoA thioesterase [Rhodocyclaceae bacterium]
MLVAALSERAKAHRVFRLPLRVYYEDTDAGAVVYYANYLKFCERARTEWLRAAGFQQAELLETRKLVFVVRSFQADYLRPAGLDDLLEVVTRIEKVGHASISFAQDVEREGSVLFQARVTVACVDWGKRKSAPIPEDIKSRLLAMQFDPMPGETTR